VHEYGRELWVDQGGHLAFADLLHIAQVQAQREEEAAEQAHRYLFCDTSPLTTLFYCVDDFGKAEPELEALAAREYDLHVLCAPDIPFDQDGTRKDEAFRQRQNDWYQQELTARGFPWILVFGPVEARVQQVLAKLG
jgi:nicotinamide riboside kinase